MNSIKCTHCSLVNLDTDFVCRRCGSDLFPSPKLDKTYGSGKGPKKGISIFSIILIGGVVAFFVYAYTGIQKEMNAIDATEAGRQAAQPQNGQGFTSRSEEEKKRTGSYANAVQNSQGLAESQKHLEETQKLMQQPANTQKK